MVWSSLGYQNDFMFNRISNPMTSIVTWEGKCAHRDHSRVHEGGRGSWQSQDGNGRGKMVWSHAKIRWRWKRSGNKMQTVFIYLVLLNELGSVVPFSGEFRYKPNTGWRSSVDLDKRDQSQFASWMWWIQAPIFWDKQTTIHCEDRIGGGRFHSW